MAGKITLSESNNETRIEWKINHFFIREDNLIISSDFILFKSKWILQMHLGPNASWSVSDTENHYWEPLRMSLLSLNPTTEYHIEYRMGIQTLNGSEITTEKFKLVVNEGFCQTPQRRKLISKKDFERYRTTLVTENTLTVFCTVRLMTTVNPAGDVSSPSSSTSFLLFFDESKMTGGEITSYKSKNETRVEWRINDFSYRNTTYINSPDFTFSNLKWFLQIEQASSFIKLFSEPDTVSDSFLFMNLKIISDLKARLHIEYGMGIQMSNGSEIRTEKFESVIEPFDRFIGNKLKIISRKDLESSSDILDSQKTLNVFCTLRLLSHIFPSNITLLYKFPTYHYGRNGTIEGTIILEDKSINETRIQWMITHFFARESDFMMNSPNFMLFKSGWFLQIIRHDNIFLPVIRNNNVRKKYLFMRIQRDYISTADHHIEYRMGIERPDGSEVITEKFESVFQPRFIKELPERELILEEDLENLGHTLTHWGTLKVFCTVRLLSDDNSAENVQPSITSTHDMSTSSETSKGVCNLKGNTNLSKNFEGLYRSKRLTDVTITVKNKNFQAHKLILSTRSDVFASMFVHDTSEERSGVVEVTDCDPDSFEDFLLYLYAGKLDTVSSSNAASLYKTADKYGVEELRDECVRCMSREMTVDSFCEIFHLAALHGESDLLAIATSFFIRNANAILVTKEWLTLLEEHASLCNELFVKFAKSGLQK